MYIDLARKHRPQTLDEMFGQDAIVTQLKGMFKEDNISNAFLLVGSSGCGKTTLGRIIYRYVNCTDFNKKTSEPCGKCFSCTSEFPSDLVELDAGSNSGVDTLRDLIYQAGLAPQGKYKVFLLNEVQAIQQKGWNTLLTILEDTPHETIFILTTTEPERVPEAIINRCRRLDIARVNKDDCKALLAYISTKEELDEQIFNDDVFEQIALYANGHLRQAVRALESTRDYVAGKGAIKNVANLLSEITEKVLRAPEWQLALKYLLAIYRGKYTGALRVVESLENFEGFIKLVLEYHTQSIYHTMSEKLTSTYYKWYYTELEQHKIPNDINFAVKLCTMAEVLVKTAFDVKSYLIDSKFVLVATTVKLSTMFGNSDGE